MQLSDYGDLFVSESRDHLAAINHLLLALEADPGASAPLEGVFRAVHTIKGMAATMGYAAVAELAHELENLLDQLRRGERAVDPELADLLFQGTDELERSVERASGGETGEPSPLLPRLRAASGEVAVRSDRVSAVVAAEENADPVPPPGLTVEVTVAAECPLPGVRAFLVLRRAREMGVASEVWPAEGTLAGSEFAGTLRFALATELPADTVRAALVEVGEIERVAVADARTAEAPGVAPEFSALRAAGNVRVDVRRLDALMNGVGELVIVRDRLQRLRPAGAAELGDALDHAARLIGELQEQIVGARLVPVAMVLERFPRLVRDAARSLGKRVELQMEGRETQFDRSVLDEIGDPLVHLLRNAVDHGVESPEERRRAGKPETGTIRLSASRERSRVVIRVEDDGGGISRAGVLAKAIASGILSAQAARTLTDDEVLRLVLQPGFSTAAAVTDVSGRGVGLDVVATRVRALGGTLEIASEPGRGTTFTLRLPLSLAIVRALLVHVGDERYAVPLTHVSEATELYRDALNRVGGRAMVTLRDEVLPLLDLGALLGRPWEPAERFTVVVLDLGERTVALRVEGLLGQQEVVVKGFDSTVCTLRLFSGATILADGRPALILDIDSVAAREGAAAA